MVLKICQLCNIDFTLKHFLLPLVDRMQEEGWEVVSVCSSGPYVQDLRKDGYFIETIHIDRSFNIFRHFKSVLILTRYFKEQKFDIVHVHSPVAALVARVAARLASVPLVIYTAHGFYFHDEMPLIKKTFFLLLEKWAGLFTDILFTQSNEDAACAINKKLIWNGEVYAIGNGVNPKEFNPMQVGDSKIKRKSLGIPEKAFVFGIIGRLVKEKGVGEFLQAAVEASEENENIYFLVIGERLDSDHAKGVSTAIYFAKQKLRNRILFLGQRTDIPELISTIDVFCLPSWREGMPRSIIEAMMMAKPVIATNIRGSREEVVDGETGFLIPTRNVSKLKEKLLYSASHCKKMKKMGIAGRARALEFFDERKVVEKQIKLIKTFVSGKNKYEAAF